MMFFMSLLSKRVSLSYQLENFHSYTFFAILVFSALASLSWCSDSLRACLRSAIWSPVIKILSWICESPSFRPIVSSSNLELVLLGYAVDGGNYSSNSLSFFSCWMSKVILSSFWDSEDSRRLWSLSISLFLSSIMLFNSFCRSLCLCLSG